MKFATNLIGRRGNGPIVEGGAVVGVVSGEIVYACESGGDFLVGIADELAGTARPVRVVRVLDLVVLS